MIREILLAAMVIAVAVAGPASNKKRSGQSSDSKEDGKNDGQVDEYEDGLGMPYAGDECKFLRDIILQNSNPNIRRKNGYEYENESVEVDPKNKTRSPKNSRS